MAQHDGTKDRIWTHLSRADVVTSLSQFAVGLGTFVLGAGAALSWVAQRWSEVTGGSWPASVFVGLAASCIITLVISFGLFAYRYFRPLQKVAAVRNEGSTPEEEVDAVAAYAPSIEAGPKLQASNNPLKDAIDAFLAKRGRVADYDSFRGPTVSMQDTRDGRGPYIATWDYLSLGPWPTVRDGFTEHQLSKLPRPPTGFRSQAAKERLANSLDEMSAILTDVNKQVTESYQKFIRALVAESSSLANGKIGTSIMLAALGEIATALMKSHRELYDEGGLLPKNEIDADELSSILKRGMENHSFGEATAKLADGVSILDSINAPRSLELMFLRILPGLRGEFEMEMQKFQAWIRECKARVDMTRGAMNDSPSKA